MCRRERGKKFSYYDTNNDGIEEMEEYISEHDDVGSIAEKLQAAFKRLENKKSCLSCKHLRKEDDAYFCDAGVTKTVIKFCTYYEEKEY